LSINDSREIIEESLKPTDWDFREIPSRYLRIATEYEYLRESRLRPIMEDWLRTPFADTAISRYPFAHRKLLKAIKFIDYEDESPLGIYESRSLGAHLPPRSGFKGASLSFSDSALYDAAVAQANEIQIQACRVGDFIRAVFDRVEDPGERQDAVNVLRDELPETLRNAGAEFFALRYDLFPESWLEIQERHGLQYFTRRDEWHEDRGEPVDERFHTVERPEQLEIIGGFQLVLLRIDWTKTNDEIEASFRRWLKDARNGPRRGPMKQATHLTRLSALRLDNAGLRFPHGGEKARTRRRKHGVKSASTDLPVTEDKATWSDYIREARALLDNQGFLQQIRSDFRYLVDYKG
jgi:hypothetical protein